MNNSKRISLIATVLLFSGLVLIGLSLVGQSPAGEPQPVVERSEALAPQVENITGSSTSGKAAYLSATYNQLEQQSTQQVAFEMDLINAPALTAAAPQVQVPEGCEANTNLAFESTLFDLINQERANAGLPAFTRQDQLNLAASEHNIDLSCRNIFSHTGSDGSSPFDRITRQGYSYTTAGENLYAGSGPYDDPAEAVSAWMKSPGHLANMLHTEYTEVGISYINAPNSTYKGYFAVTFGQPK
jgi:uncharacterized protein YkwD